MQNIACKVEQVAPDFVLADAKEGCVSNIANMTKVLHEIAALPESEARCLPGSFYSDPEYFRYEVEAFLSREWHCLGRAEEIPNPGDYMTARLFDEPLLVVRGADGIVRVMSNLCRHRGMTLAEGTGNAKRFVCPYHAWSYSLSGRLRKAPMMKDRAPAAGSCALPEFRSEVWNGFIYANLDDDAEPLAPRLDGLDAMLARYRPQDFRFVQAFEEEWKTNWKCLFENFMEAYHLNAVHPETLLPFTPTGLSRKAADGDGFTSYYAHYPETAASRGHGAPDLAPADRRYSTLFGVYPGHVASQVPAMLVSLSIHPLAVDRIRVRWTVSAYRDELPQAEIDRWVATWHEINREDREKLEKMQTGLSSRHAPSGPLGPRDLEGTIWDFYRYMSGKLDRPEPSLVTATG